MNCRYCRSDIASCGVVMVTLVLYVPFLTLQVVGIPYNVTRFAKTCIASPHIQFFNF